MMKLLTNCATFFLAVMVGCSTPGGGGGGQGDDNGGPPGQNDNVTSNGGGGPAGGNDNQDNVPSNDNAPDQGDDPGQNDNGDDSDELPTAFRLDGVWDDNGRHVIIEQNGTEVEANYFSERYCHPETGTSEEPIPGAESTFFDFRGTLNNGEDVLPGDTLAGEVTTCRYGFDEGENGFVLAGMTLTVVDENTLSGEWEYDEDGDGEPDRFGSMTVTRQQ